jgi:hypothetical protein
MKSEKNLKVVMDTNHKPLSGWLITKKGKNYYVNYDSLPEPIYLGKSHSYRYDSSTTTSGLSRPGYVNNSHEILFNPSKWNKKYKYWTELIYPTAYAESSSDFTAMNFWDKAGFTPGFIQLAAHTADDLIPFMKQLINELPQESHKFFPELKVVNGKLSFVSGQSYRSLEVRHPAPDPLPKDLVNRGLFVGYFNRNRKRIGEEEKQAAARWLIWTLTSPNMRKLQVEASIQNMKVSLRILHKALMKNGSHKYPRGVDGLRCDHLAAALAVPHLSPRKVGRAVSALLQNDVLEAFKNIEYGPGNRELHVLQGVNKRRKTLSRLTFDLSEGHPVASTS